MTLSAPQTRADWETQREDIRKRWWNMLGDMPPLFTPQVKVLERIMREGSIVEHLAFDNGAGAQVYGYLLLPPNQAAPAPAVVYLHGHGFKYEIGKEDVFRERMPAIRPGPALVAAGYVVLAIDVYGFGERQHDGPAGDTESGAAAELALFKHFLWQGSSLWGMMVRDDLLALNYLLTRPEVDPTRVGVTGMSLGGSRATWIGALDERPRVVVPMGQMTRYRDFAATGCYNLHSIYYYLPGVLKSDLDMEHLVALVAPRSQAILIGAEDPLSPVVGVHTVLDYARQVYDLYRAGEELQAMIEPGVGHQFTLTMFQTMLAAMNRALVNR